jgi:hypothetical protein
LGRAGLPRKTAVATSHLRPRVRPAVGCSDAIRWYFLIASPIRQTILEALCSRRVHNIPEIRTMSTLPYRIAREQRVIRTILLALSGVLLIAACDDYDDDDYNPTEPVPPAATVLTATGNITAKVDEYRLLLGDPKNGATIAGPAAAGRREVNWDGVSGANVNTNAFPGNFFNTTTKLGLVMTTPGTGLRVSDNDFADVNAAFGEVFNPFSNTKTFAAVGSPITDVTFQVGRWYGRGSRERVWRRVRGRRSGGRGQDRSVRQGWKEARHLRRSRAE